MQIKKANNYHMSWPLVLLTSLSNIKLFLILISNIFYSVKLPILYNTTAQTLINTNKVNTEK